MPKKVIAPKITQEKVEASSEPKEPTLPNPSDEEQDPEFKEQQALSSKVKEDNKIKGLPVVKAPDVNDLSNSDQERLYAWKKEETARNLAKQDKVRIMIPLRDGEARNTYESVIINGYRMDIKKGVFVDVPQQVAEILAESYELTLHAGEDSLIENLGQKIDPTTGKPKNQAHL